LQISSFWREGEIIHIDLCAGGDFYTLLRNQRQAEGRRQIATELARHLPARLVEYLTQDWAQSCDLRARLADQSDEKLKSLCNRLTNWELTPSGSEGYRTAEVTLGGISTDGIDSKTMMSKSVSGLYFIGECVDVTGWLGGFNFQWAWSSGFACAQSLNAN
jgi:predicted Rossmann fold flavoprotein